ncbi:hypothetical protein [Curtobacterium sp. 24E2]|nr:hypothetical protein JN350_09645 [Curtobacterium sp. 24E2]
MAESPTPTSSSSSNQAAARSDAERHTGEVQRRIADTFASSAVASETTRDWVLLACAADAVQSAGGITLQLAKSVPVDEAYESIRGAISDEPSFTTKTDQTSKGLDRLSLSNGAGERYLVTIDDDGDRPHRLVLAVLPRIPGRPVRCPQPRE